VSGFTDSASCNQIRRGSTQSQSSIIKTTYYPWVSPNTGNLQFLLSFLRRRTDTSSTRGPPHVTHSQKPYFFNTRRQRHLNETTTTTCFLLPTNVLLISRTKRQSEREKMYEAYEGFFVLNREISWFLLVYTEHSFLSLRLSSFSLFVIFFFFPF